MFVMTSGISKASFKLDLAVQRCTELPQALKRYVIVFFRASSCQHQWTLA